MCLLRGKARDTPQRQASVHTRRGFKEAQGGPQARDPSLRPSGGAGGPLFLRPSKTGEGQVQGGTPGSPERQGEGPELETRRRGGGPTRRSSSWAPRLLGWGGRAWRPFGARAHAPTATRRPTPWGRRPPVRDGEATRRRRLEIDASAASLSPGRPTRKSRPPMRDGEATRRRRLEIHHDEMD